MTRQQIEAVLRKHGLAVEGTSYLSVADTTVCALITDLLALAPPPSREALTELLTRFAIYIRRPKEELSQTKVWKEEFLAWAQGTPPELRWCTHLRRDDTTPGECWLFRDLAGYGTADWRWCPVCHAPRPSEARG